MPLQLALLFKAIRPERDCRHACSRSILRHKEAFVFNCLPADSKLPDTDLNLVSNIKEDQMNDDEIKLHEDARTLAAAVLDEMLDELPLTLRKEVLVEIVAKAGVSRLTRNSPRPAELEQQINFLARLLIEEAPASPLDAQLVLQAVALNEATQRQVSYASDERTSERHREFSLSFASRAMINHAKVMQAREAMAGRRKTDMDSSRATSIVAAIEAGKRRLELADARRTLANSERSALQGASGEHPSRKARPIPKGGQ
ncbi:hypothetical protein [Qipengyuania gaetbuli]|uniref:hypothetical protein n=1 Tax=Qipengyuania gaetbuli TaxID=266952 RepID=UPI001CD7FD60|nr:hypothetical protein [Qipengyuania gaetbuli]MCA0911042.1 hypothetical protein [Qipengyuania gaetbuli]